MSKGKVRGGEVVTETRPHRTVNPDKEFRFYYRAKGSHWKVLTRRGTEPLHLLKRTDVGLKLKAELN